MKDKIIKNMEKAESFLSCYATKSSDSMRFKKNTSCIRLSFARDIDRIIHSSAYTRYIGKTQVYSIENDKISRRITHVQFVNRIARTIARALGLNEDLCEAIALGHDLGHIPFGHEGERMLNEISKRETGEIFAHNVQSVRTLMNIEKNGKGLNISLQVLDGILCHNGEFLSHIYKPVKKSKEEFLKEYNESYKSEEILKNLRPMTLEGCVVRLSDIIAYVGRDIEDAEKLKRFSKDKLTKEIVEIVGDTNKDIINNIVLDVINNSMDKPYISMSEKMYNILKKLKKFNYENIYYSANTTDELKLYKKMFNELFDVYIKALQSNDKNNDIVKEFLNGMNDEYLKNTTNERKVIDYIAGMTDRFFYKQYNKYIKVNS